MNQRSDSAAPALGWIALALAGQLSILLLTRAGRTVGYQHFVPLGASSVLEWGAAGLLVVQGLVVLRALAGRWGALQDMRRALAPGWRLPAVVGAVVLTSATLSRQPVVYALELVLAGAAQLRQYGRVHSP